MKVAGYARMSTDKQQLSPETQERIIREWFTYQQRVGKFSGEDEFIGMFVDKAVTSRIDTLDRPNGQMLIPALDPGDMIVVAKYNRAFRSAADCERTLDRCNEAGISFVFLDLNIDTRTANGRMMSGIMAVVSRHERDLLSETTRDALRTLRLQGRPTTAPYPGFRIVTDRRTRQKKYAIDEDIRTLGEIALELMFRGKSFNRIYWDVRKIDPHTPNLHGLRTAATGCFLGWPRAHCSEWRAVFSEYYPEYPVPGAKFLRNVDRTEAMRIINNYIRERDKQYERQLEGHL